MPNTKRTAVIIMDFDKVNKEDILCGKEKKCVAHPGSVNFRRVIEEYAPKYNIAVTKQEKMNVTKEIYDMLGAQNSRFLKYSNKSKGWEELSSLLARDKISHALRFALRDKKNPASATTTSKSRRSHRRTDSDESNSTLTTVATELSLDEFENLLVDDEPLDWHSSSSPTSCGGSSEHQPYAQEVSYDSSATPVPYHEHFSSAPPAYYHPYHNYPAPSYYYPHPPQPYYSAPPPIVRRQPSEETMFEFPDLPLPEAPARKSTMEDVDLEYLVSEPLMEF